MGAYDRWKYSKGLIEIAPASPTNAGNPSSNINFADANVKALCVANWDTNEDGELSLDEAAAVTDLGTVFKSSNITSFNELQYFTGITTIPYMAFNGCLGLTYITIPNSVTSIDDLAFSDCQGLTTITIPNSVTLIGYNAFYMTSPYIFSPNGVFYVDKWACGYKGPKTSITAISLQEGTVGIADKAFRNLTNMTSVNIPNSVTSICRTAFASCSNLTSVDIPNSVTSIGQGAFYGCSNLTSVTVGMETPVEITENVFTNRTNATLYVPAGSKLAYKAANYWKDFDGIVETVTIKIATNSGSDREAIGYSSEYGLDFTNVTDVKAYIATGFTDDGDVLLSRVYIVPANTGIYLKSVAGAGIEVTVPTTDRYVLYVNLLKPYIGTGTLASSETIDNVKYNNYVVGTLNGKPSFAIWGGGTFGPHKAYMPIPDPLVPAAARAGGFSVKYIDEEPTGINESMGSAPESDALYDLQGRKVSNAKRGIYVRNGKKIFIK